MNVKRLNIIISSTPDGQKSRLVLGVRHFFSLIVTFHNSYEKLNIQKPIPAPVRGGPFRKGGPLTMFFYVLFYLTF